MLSADCQGSGAWTILITILPDGCLVALTDEPIMPLVVVIITVLKDIKVVKDIQLGSDGGSVLRRIAPGVVLLLRSLLLCKHGRRYIPAVCKWGSRRWLFLW